MKNIVVIEFDLFDEVLKMYPVALEEYVEQIQRFMQNGN
jgi:hypothetical protein